MFSRILLRNLGRLGQHVNYYKAPLFWDKKLGYKNSLRIAEIWAIINEYTSLSVIQTFRMSRLNKLLENAYKHVPFYNELYRANDINFSKPLDETSFKKFPIVKKSDLRNYINSEKYHTQNIPSWRQRKTMTSGSSGEPFCFPLDNAYTVEMIAMGNRIWRWAGANVRKPKILCAPESAKKYYPNLIYFPHSSLQSRMKEYIDIIHSNKIGLIFGTPIMAFDFLRLYAKTNRSVPFRKAVLGGHVVTPGMRKYFLDVFGCEIFEFYASAEVRMIGIECEQHDGLHIQEENIIVEIVDENGVDLPSGKVGKVVVTSLSNEIMPFIRYELGDLGKILSRSCSCGRTSRLLKIQGRTNEPLLLSPDGNAIAPATLRDILDPFFPYFYRYQLIQTSHEDFILKIVPTATYVPEIAKQLIVLLKKEIGGSCAISLECVSEIPPLPSGKFQYFVSSFWKEKFSTALFDVPELKNDDQ